MLDQKDMNDDIKEKVTALVSKHFGTENFIVIVPEVQVMVASGLDPTTIACVLNGIVGSMLEGNAILRNHDITDEEIEDNKKGMN